MLTPAWFPLRKHLGQSGMLRCRKRYLAAACGRGSGKTEVARRRIVMALPVRKPWPDPKYFFALPTYRQARRVAWDKIRALVPPEWVKGKIHDGDMTIETIFGSTLFVVGLDKPQRVEGDQYDGCIIDESCDQKPGVFERSVQPALSHRKGFCWRLGVPKRFGCGAVEFKEFFDKGVAGDPNIASFAWASSTVLSPEEIAIAQATLSPTDYAEQYGASWESAGGLIFQDFSMENVEEVPYVPSMPLTIGSDFNVNPMCWVIGHVHKNEIHIIDEIFRRNTNTRDTLGFLHNRYIEHTSGWNFYGDASSRARKTAASESDYIQIRNDRRFVGGRVFYPRSNPSVVNRFAATNAMLCNASHERRLKIHPRCKHLIRDLKTRAYKEGTREPDDYGDVGHITDALGYIVHRLFPVKHILAGKPGVYSCQ